MKLSEKINEQVPASCAQDVFVTRRTLEDWAKNAEQMEQAHENLLAGSREAGVLAAEITATALSGYVSGVVIGDGPFGLRYTLKAVEGLVAHAKVMEQAWIPVERILPKMKPDYPTRSERVLVLWSDDNAEIAQLERYEDNTFRWVVQGLRGETYLHIDGTMWRLIPKRRHPT